MDLLFPQASTTFEDPLSYLPLSSTRDYQRGAIVYEADAGSGGIHMVVEGYVKLARIVGQSEIALELCQPDDIFGESAFVACQGERAEALCASRVMTWPLESVRDRIHLHPDLGVALIQLASHRCIQLAGRLAALSTESSSRRLARVLIELSGRVGETECAHSDTRRLTPLSHKVLSQYIGATREAVTHCMNRFRRWGLVEYSRREIVVHGDSLKQWLTQSSTNQKSPALHQARSTR